MRAAVFATAPQLDAHVNTRVFGSKMDTIDDFHGAIGEGMFHAAAVGRVEARSTRHDSDVKPSPTTRRRGLDRAWLHLMTGGDDQPHASDVKPSPTTCRRGLDRAGLRSMTNPTQATSSRRLQRVGAGLTALGCVQ